MWWIPPIWFILLEQGNRTRSMTAFGSSKQRMKTHVIIRVSKGLRKGGLNSQKEISTNRGETLLCKAKSSDQTSVFASLKLKFSFLYFRIFILRKNGKFFFLGVKNYISALWPSCLCHALRWLHFLSNIIITLCSGDLLATYLSVKPENIEVQTLKPVANFHAFL